MKKIVIFFLFQNISNCKRTFKMAGTLLFIYKNTGSFDQFFLTWSSSRISFVLTNKLLCNDKYSHKNCDVTLLSSCTIN